MARVVQRRRQGSIPVASCTDKGGEVEERSVASLHQNRGRNGGGPVHGTRGRKERSGGPDGVSAMNGGGGGPGGRQKPDPGGSSDRSGGAAGGRTVK
jgi:hypothetical protein